MSNRRMSPLDVLQQTTTTQSDWLAADGELAERIRAVDWSSTSLGPREAWPQSLRSVVGMLLASRAQIILFWGPEHVVLYNDAYRPVFALKHPWALGRPGHEAWSEVWRETLHPLLDGVVKTGHAFWAQDHPFVVERRGYPEETYFDISYDPVRDESGAVAGVFCIVSETTGRVVGERRLRILRDLARAVQAARTTDDVFGHGAKVLAGSDRDIAFAVVYSFDAGSERGRRVCAVNAPQGTPWAPELLDRSGPWPLVGLEPGGRMLDEAAIAHFGPLPGGACPEPAKNVMIIPLETAGQGAQSVLIVGLTPRRPVDDNYRDFLRLIAGSFASALSSAAALEAQRRRAEALTELDRAKTAFFSNVSHEFRTPLTLLLAPLQDALGTHSGVPQSLRPQLESAHRNALRLLKLVNTLLDFSRIEAGRMSASFTPVDLAAATRELASHFNTACERANLSLDVHCEPLREDVWVDRDLWEKIVLNLLSNAFKHTFEGGIEVRVEDASDGAVLSIRDTGVGISREDLPRIFERFHRVEGTRARSHEGSGIGLALVQELTHLHGGRLGVTSDVGRGSRFEAFIPYGNGHLPTDQVHATKPHAAGGQPRAFVEEALGWLRGTAPADEMAGESVDDARILVVDDNADMREHLSRILREHWNVASAADGEEALERLRAERFDVVVTDVMMPRLDGFGLLSRIRADSAIADLCVIMLSARAGEEARLEGIEAGADDYLVKPFGARELVAQVRSQLSIRRLRLSSSSEREKLLRRAEAANRTKDEFLAMLGHELRNPLSPIVGAIKVMRLRGVDAPELDILERQSTHLTRLVNDLLDISRITRGRLDLHRHLVDMRDVLTQAMDMASPLLNERRHYVDLRVPMVPLHVSGDADRLAQVVANLLTNAAKYSDPGSAIRLRCDRDGQRICVVVEDEGVGIAPEMKARIFDLFVQQSQTLDRAAGGLGLGLAIVKSLVELHGGEVRVESEGRGRGSRFIVELPAAQVAPSAHPLAAPRPQRRATETYRVLIVDDNADALKMLGRALGFMGHKVESVRDGEAALAAAQRFDPQIALIDIGLPGMDGYELAKRMRCLKRPPGRLFAITGYGLETDRKRAFDAGFDRHFIKPVDVIELDAAFGAPSQRSASTV